LQRSSCRESTAEDSRGSRKRDNGWAENRERQGKGAEGIPGETCSVSYTRMELVVATAKIIL
jgi:hypothetical protein